MRCQADPLDVALEDLRVSGSVLLNESYRPPWAVAIPEEKRLRVLLGLDASVRVLVFHLAQRGGFDVAMPGCDALRVNEAEVVICAGGRAHRMGRGTRARVLPLEDILRRKSPALVPEATEGASECICGVFLVRAAPLNPMLGALPPIMKVSVGRGATTPMLGHASQMLASELASGSPRRFLLARLLEIFCAESIRAYQQTCGARVRGWFRGLADPKIAHAMGEIHAAPGTDWSVSALAAGSALSPSRFAARFREATGQTVMTYVARWRLNVACRLLADTRQSISQVGAQVGYESLPSFSRAFKSQLGQAPAQWRREHCKPTRT